MYAQYREQRRLLPSDVNSLFFADRFMMPFSFSPTVTRMRAFAC